MGVGEVGCLKRAEEQNKQPTIKNSQFKITQTGCDMPRLHDEDHVEDDKMHEECGIFGVWAPGEEVARLTYFGLYALQHRGQESAGIATSDGSQLMLHTRMGLV